MLANAQNIMKEKNRTKVKKKIQRPVDGLMATRNNKGNKRVSLHQNLRESQVPKGKKGTEWAKHETMDRPCP